MRLSPVFPAIAIAAVILLGQSQFAATDDRELCKTASGDAAIEACTRAIESKKFNGKKQKRVLSLLYTNRGVEYEIKRRSPTTTRRSKSIRRTQPPTTTAAVPTPASRIGARHRRLRHGDQA